ncbi:MAG: DUF86 domain-containing protein [Nitrospinota bacterium]
MQGLSLETLPKDRKTLQAVIRCIEIIGEAASKISKEFKEQHPHLPWKNIVGMRNWLIHAYFDIYYNHIWNTVHKDLPELVPLLQKILSNEPK